MSMIHEALKKAGQPMMAEEPQNTSETKSGFRPELLRKKPRSPWGPFIALLVLVLVGAPVFAPLIHHSDKTNGEISAGLPLSASSGSMKRQFAIEETVLPVMPNAWKTPARHLPNFSLSGLVYSPEDSYGLINGKVVRVGEHVGDATLTQVTPNEAVLDYRGEKIVLSASTG